MTDAATAEATTSAELAASRLRADIRTGALAPQKKLQLRFLCERYGMSSSPIREALSRLASEGLVTAAGQRGFWVAAATADDLYDILQFRTVVEGAALRIACERGDERWELGVVGAFHRLQKHARRRDASGAWLDAWEPLHKAFHMALIAACGSRRMQETSARLYDDTERYRRLYWHYQFPTEALITEHRELMEIVLACDADAAQAAHRRHMDLTFEMLAKIVRGEEAEGA